MSELERLISLKTLLEIQLKDKCTHNNERRGNIVSNEVQIICCRCNKVLIWFPQYGVWRKSDDDRLKKLLKGDYSNK
jgi:hypothetical protein